MHVVKYNCRGDEKKMEQIRRIREKQDQLITLINATFDEIVAELERTTQGTQTMRVIMKVFIRLQTLQDLKGRSQSLYYFKKKE